MGAPAREQVGRAASIDALRALAALGILVFHTGGIPGATGPNHGLGRVLYRNLDAGVILFFVVSGYVIARPFVLALVDGARFPNLERYAWRRVCRICPAFWIALAAAALLIRSWSSDPGATGLSNWWQIPVHALFLQNVVPGQFPQLLQVSWTLHNEVIFYALVPVVAGAVAWRWRGRVAVDGLAVLLLAVWATSFLCAYAAAQLPLFTDGSAIARYTFPAMMGFFCPGILVALAFSESAKGRGGSWDSVRRTFVDARRWIPLACVLAAAAMAYWWLLVNLQRQSIPDLRWHLFAAASGVLLAGVLAGGPRVEALSRPLQAIGLASYGIYLWHVVVIHFVHDWGIYFQASDMGVLAFPANVLIVGAITLSIAWASWVFVERPALRWAAGRGRRPQPQWALEPALEAPGPS